MIIEKKKISDLKPAPYNPRKSSDKQEANLKKSLEKFGVVEPIVFNKQTGHIVGGHFRIRELKKLGYKEVDCVIVDLNEDDEKELNIRLNANTGDWDFDELANNWDAGQLTEWGLDIPVWEGGPVSIDDLGLKDNAFAEEANQLSFSITFNFPISEKQAFDAFDKLELENVLKNFVYAQNVKYINL